MASAQKRSEIEHNRASIQAKRTSIVSEALDLTDEEANAFWPLYKQYRAELGKNEDFETSLLLELEESGFELQDEQALRLLDQAMKLDRTRLEVIQKYMAEFKKILPGKKVARFFHLEAKRYCNRRSYPRHIPNRNNTPELRR